MEKKIERLQAMARDALRDYQHAIAAGGEPDYPQWADDMLEVCQRAELSLQSFYPVRTQADRAGSGLHS